MIRTNFKAYEGSKKYIFISYAHKDAEKVYPIIDRLNSEGYRIWFDDGISAGSEWPEYIARHLDSCDMVLFFASPSSVASDNCRREVNFAMSRSKKFLSIILEPTDFTLGMELQLSSQQSILKYDLPDEEIFYDKLLKAPLLEDSRRAFGEQDEVTPAGASEDIVKDIMEQNAFNNYARDLAEEDAVKNMPKPNRKPWLPIAIAVGAAIILAVCVLAGKFILDRTVSQTITFSNGQDFSSKTSHVDLKGLAVTKADISKLNKIKGISNLSFTDCDFSNCPDLNKIKIMGQIYSLSIDNCTGIKDYSFTKKLKDCDNITIISDPNFKDANILNSMPNLRTVKLDNTGVTDITSLFSNPEIYKITVCNCNLSNITLNADNSSITYLVLSNCSLDNIEFVKHIKYLLDFDISYNPVSDLTPLSNRASDIFSLNISGTNPDNLSLELLAQFTDINQFVGDDNNYPDLSFISTWSNLTNLSLAGCNLDTIYPNLLDNKPLEYLDVSCNNLQTVPSLDTNSISSLISVNVANNRLTSLDGLPACDYHMLSCYGNNLDYTSSENLRILNCSIDNAIIDYNESINNLPIASYDYAIILDSPVTFQAQYSNIRSVNTNYTSDGFKQLRDEFGYNIFDWIINDDAPLFY